MPKMMKNPRTMTNLELADFFGGVKAKIAALEEQIDTLKNDFLRRGFAVIDGKRYRLTHLEGRVDTVLDHDAIRADMSKRWIAAHSKPQTVRPSCKVSAIVNKRVSKPAKAVAAAAAAIADAEKVPA